MYDVRSKLSDDKSFMLYLQASANQESARAAEVDVHCVIILDSWYDCRYEFQKYEKVPIHKRSHKLETGQE